MIKQSKILLFLLCCTANIHMQAADIQDAEPAKSVENSGIWGTATQSVNGFLGAANAAATIGTKIYQGVQWAYEHPKTTATLGCASAYGLYKASHSTPVRFVKNTTLITAGALVAYRTLVADEEIKDLIVTGCNTVLSELHAIEGRISNLIIASDRKNQEGQKALAARLDRIEAHIGSSSQKSPDILDQSIHDLESNLPENPKSIQQTPGLLKRGWNWFTSPCTAEFDPAQNASTFI